MANSTAGTAEKLGDNAMKVDHVQTDEVERYEIYSRSRIQKDWMLVPVPKSCQPCDFKEMQDFFDYLIAKGPVGVTNRLVVLYKDQTRDVIQQEFVPSRAKYFEDKDFKWRTPPPAIER